MGGLIGARLGVDGIPLEWKNKTSNHQAHVELAQKLVDLRAKFL